MLPSGRGNGASVTSVYLASTSESTVIASHRSGLQRLDLYGDSLALIFEAEIRRTLSIVVVVSNQSMNASIGKDCALQFVFRQKADQYAANAGTFCQNHIEFALRNTPIV